MTLKLFPGTPAESLQLPSIPQDEDHVRLLMYAVRLNPGATELSERDWYDYREDRNVCGYCRCILGKCRITEMLAQLAQIEADISEYNETVQALTTQVETLQTEVDDIIGGIVEIGTCGENIHYVLYENGKLLLHGTGETYDYEISRSPFWEREDIRSLVIGEGITAIGTSVFERCYNMATVTFPSTLTTIKARAFFMYTQGGLTSLTIPPTITTIGEKAFVDRPEAILHCSRLNRLFGAGQDIFVGFSLEFNQKAHHALRNRNLSVGRFAFRIGNDELCFTKCARTLDTLHGLADGQYPFFEVDIAPLKRTQFSYAEPSGHGKGCSHRTSILVSPNILLQGLLFCFVKKLNLRRLPFWHHNSIQRIKNLVGSDSIFEDSFHQNHNIGNISG